MHERRRIIELWKRGDAAALITLVGVEGSSYRRPGARLLIAANGDYAGSISGGCLEAELIRKAQWAVRGGAVLQHYSTLFDDTAEIPFGLGCGGTVDVLLEPVDTPEFAALMSAMESSLAGIGRRIVTTLPRGNNRFARNIFDADGTGAFRSEPSAEHADPSLLDEQMLPPQRLIVFGAGDDAHPLVHLAALLGWRVAVVDGRSQWARPERFPEAFVVTTNADALELGENDAVAIMTHSYEQDRQWLIHALRCRPRYVGLLGARHRSALLMSEAAATLCCPVDDVCAAVLAPMGLDLGGDGAEAIALAAVAEMQGVVEGKLQAPRRMTVEEVSAQIAEGGASRYLQTQCAL
jgi:xanthine dehydrogenase accessory factor